MASGKLQWWQQEVIYQVLVPSFLDTTGGGFGDLRGIRERLDYLQWLGVGALWLSPIYPSPLADLGYDVTNYNAIDPRFGSLRDFDELLAAAHRRNLKIILDWVPNHTSDEHPWFVEATSSRDHPRRDWYVWRDARPDGSPPSNWISVFGGSVWSWHKPTGQFYLHTFLDKQPDLNWRHPDVQSAMLDSLRFWLERGVDGFRIDALDLIFEDEQLRDNPPNPDYGPEQGPDSRLLPLYTRDQPELHGIVARMRAVAEEFGGDRLLAGEMYLPNEKIVTYYGNERPELHLPLNLQLAWTPWNAEKLGRTIAEFDQAVTLARWPAWTISTHDSPRLATRCPGEQVRVAAMLLMTLRGTVTHYYGEELGMHGVPIPAALANDPQGRRIGRNRDPERTPMQWNAGPHAGFSLADPWLPVGADLRTANVEAQRTDPRSLLTLYRRLIALRRTHRALVDGHFELVSSEHPLLAFRRGNGSEPLWVVLNLSHEPHSFELPRRLRVLLSTRLDREGESPHAHLELRGDEGLILEQLH